MKLYWPLIPHEACTLSINRPLVKSYTHKAIHTSVEALQIFIKEVFPKTHLSVLYVEIDADLLDVDYNAVTSYKNTVAAKLPIKHKFSAKDLRRLF
jgi:hypothetical protein